MLHDETQDLEYLLMNVDELMNKGFSRQVIDLKAQKYKNTDVNDLYQCYSQFTTLPEQEVFENLKRALQRCQKQNIIGFSYQKIVEAAEKVIEKKRGDNKVRLPQSRK